MNAMERQIATVDAHGQFVLPAEAQSALQLKPGSQWQVSIEDSHIVFEPVPSDALTALRGMFSPGPSLEDDLIEWRRLEKW